MRNLGIVVGALGVAFVCAALLGITTPLLRELGISVEFRITRIVAPLVVGLIAILIGAALIRRAGAAP